MYQWKLYIFSKITSRYLKRWQILWLPPPPLICTFQNMYICMDMLIYIFSWSCYMDKKIKCLHCVQDQENTAVQLDKGWWTQMLTILVLRLTQENKLLNSLTFFPYIPILTYVHLLSWHKNNLLILVRCLCPSHKIINYLWLR